MTHRSLIGPTVFTRTPPNQLVSATLSHLRVENNPSSKGLAIAAEDCKGQDPRIAITLLHVAGASQTGARSLAPDVKWRNCPIFL
jgi:hypothetical protein